MQLFYDDSICSTFYVQYVYDYDFYITYIYMHIIYLSMCNKMHIYIHLSL